MQRGWARRETAEGFAQIWESWPTEMPRQVRLRRAAALAAGVWVAPQLPGGPGMGQRRSLREVIPSLVKTLPRCHSTVLGADEQLGGDLLVGVPVPGQLGDLGLLGGEIGEHLEQRACARFPRWPAARGGRVRQSHPCPSRSASGRRREAARGRRYGDFRGGAIRRRADARASSARIRVRPNRSIASRYSRSASSPLLSRARERASNPSAASVPADTGAAGGVDRHHQRRPGRRASRVWPERCSPPSQQTGAAVGLAILGHRRRRSHGRPWRIAGGRRPLVVPHRRLRRRHLGRDHRRTPTRLKSLPGRTRATATGLRRLSAGPGRPKHRRNRLGFPGRTQAPQVLTERLLSKSS